jgi:hypothetical protein
LSSSIRVSFESDASHAEKREFFGGAPSSPDDVSDGELNDDE